MFNDSLITGPKGVFAIHYCNQNMPLIDDT